MGKYRNSIKRSALIIGAILTVLVAVSAAFLFDLWKKAPSKGTMTAQIFQNGELIKSIDLNQVKESYTFTVTGDNGCTNTIEVRPQSIGIISADCPDKLCISQGFIHNSLLPVTCLPNRLVIQISSSDKGPLPDSLTH